MIRKNFRQALLILTGFLLLSASQLVHAQPTVLKLGILAFKPKEVVEQQWQPIISELNRDLKRVQLEFETYNYQELRDAVARLEVDFVLTNPAFYVELSHSQGLSSPLVTMVSQYQDLPMRGFGGVILVRNDRSDLLDLQDLKHTKIATPKIGSFGAYSMQLKTMVDIGIRLNDLTFLETEMPHQKTVEAVLNRQADVAFVRTGILEEIRQSNPQAFAQLRVINQQTLPGFPLISSTRLYPEWPLAAMLHVDMELAGLVAGKLLTMPYGTEVFTKADIYGFSVPTDYEPVRELMQTLKIKPYDIEHEFSWQEIWQNHKTEISIAASALMIISLLSLLLIYFNSRLRQTLLQVKKNEEFLAVSAIAFETQEAIVITNQHEKIIRVNKAFTEITGFSAEEVIGKTPRVLSSGRQDKEFYRKMWQEIHSKGGWRGEVYNRRKNGDIYPEYQVITKIKNADGLTTNYLSTFSDITTRKYHEERIHQLAFYDPLTGLANRRLLEDHIEKAIGNSLQSHQYNALLFMDMDRFKHLNDTLGHKQGDQILKIVGRRIKDSIRDIDTAARPGGDEFIVLLESLSQDVDLAATQTQKIAEKILQQIHQPILMDNESYVISASIGISLFNSRDNSIDDLLKHSDMAMYQAKESGRNTLRFFDPKMQEAALHRARLETDLRKAIDENQFLLYYQPKVTFDGEIKGYEALIRWQHPTRGMVSPAEFIPLAEETGLILSVGRWVIEQACNTLEIWQQNPATSHLSLSINISARQFHQADFVECILKITDNYKIDLKKLEIELTESLLMDDLQDSITKMQRLNQAGINFSLDDFGTGYSSLSYLKSLPIDCLKIDQSFVRDMLQDLDDAAIVETIIALAKTLKLEVIAEGVELQEQADILHQLGCDLLQGYLYGKPEPLIHKHLNA